MWPYLPLQSCAGQKADTDRLVHRADSNKVTKVRAKNHSSNPTHGAHPPLKISHEARMRSRNTSENRSLPRSFLSHHWQCTGRQASCHSERKAISCRDRTKKHPARNCPCYAGTVNHFVSLLSFNSQCPRALETHFIAELVLSFLTLSDIQRLRSGPTFSVYKRRPPTGSSREVQAFDRPPPATPPFTSIHSWSSSIHRGWRP
jgi:hypothetical protein